MGNLKWNGKDYNIVQLEGLQDKLKLKKDTIITSGNSAIFPEGISLGQQSM